VTESRPGLSGLGQFQRMPDQGAVVDLPGLRQLSAVAVDEAGEGTPVGPLRGRLLQFLGIDEALLAAHDEVGDLIGEGRGGQEGSKVGGPAGRILRGEETTHQAHLLGSGEKDGDVDRGPVAVELQHPKSEGVEGRGGGFGHRPLQQVPDPGLQFGGGSS
jgi:hypothetical protein